MVVLYHLFVNLEMPAQGGHDIVSGLAYLRFSFP